MDHVRSLRLEAGADFAVALQTLHTLITNILSHPAEDKYRSIRLANATFQKRCGRFPSSISLLRGIGFEDANDKDSSASDGPATHLAIPLADPSLLASAVTLVSAALEASKMVDAEVAGSGGSSDGGGAAAAAAPSAAVTVGGASSSTADASASASASATAAAPSSRALGKRPMTATPRTEQEGKHKAAKREETDEGAEGAAETRTVGFAVELASYTAEAIDAYFLDCCGGPFLARLSDGASVDAATYSRYVATAREAVRITRGTGDAEAEHRASHWASALEEHGALLGWSVEDVGEEEGDVDGPSAGGSENAPPEVIGHDGNFDSCAICGDAGLLICCEACPQAYHAACLGPAAPPDDEDDDAAWFCPPCRQQLGMVS